MYPIVSVFIERPYLALFAGGVFLLLALLSRSRAVIAAAAAWSAYGLYEYGMKMRWLCTGECNIRVDLLLIYPVLVVLSVVAVYIAVSRRIGRSVGTN